ncbi:hypothetical protein DE146DRAFT_669072 [Phaeosphaeria sp. MPI-PUGE-AT-0046c]|nr:hypothetical protein DE146DRAFT_669072 [Phaeosphaeria sp. MPI-PUGE-AT-0046c]
MDSCSSTGVKRLGELGLWVPVRRDDYAFAPDSPIVPQIGLRACPSLVRSQRTLKYRELVIPVMPHNPTAQLLPQSFCIMFAHETFCQITQIPLGMQNGTVSGAPTRTACHPSVWLQLPCGLSGCVSRSGTGWRTSPCSLQSPRCSSLRILLFSKVSFASWLDDLDIRWEWRYRRTSAKTVNACLCTKLTSRPSANEKLKRNTEQLCAYCGPSPSCGYA